VSTPSDGNRIRAGGTPSPRSAAAATAATAIGGTATAIGGSTGAEGTVAPQPTSNSPARTVGSARLPTVRVNQVSGRPARDAGPRAAHLPAR